MQTAIRDRGARLPADRVGGTMTVQARPTPLHPPTESWTDLQAWIDRRLTNIEHDLDDDETAAAMGLRLRERRAVYLDLAFAIRDAVAREQAERQQEAHEDSVEQQYKAAGYDGMDPTIARLMDGDR